MHQTWPDELAEVSQQAQEYLEAICRVLERGGQPTPTELGRELCVAPPSVIGMLRRMEDQGLVTYTRQSGALLTEQGQRCADTLRRRHRLAECLLTDLLDIPWERVHEIACRFEHVIDGEVEGYLTRALDHPATCPHGNPIGDTDTHSLRALTSLQPGESACLRCIADESVPALDYLNAISLRPGVQVTIRGIAPLNGPLTVEVNGERHALAREMADNLLVEVEGDIA